MTSWQPAVSYRKEKCCRQAALVNTDRLRLTAACKTFASLKVSALSLRRIGSLGGSRLGCLPCDQKWSVRG